MNTVDERLKEFAQATRPKKKASSQSVNVTGSGNTIVIGDNIRHIGQPVPVEQMTDEELQAIKDGRWDGIERRDPLKETKDHGQRRASDLQEHVLYYSAVFTCLLIILVWAAFAWSVKL